MQGFRLAYDIQFLDADLGRKRKRYLSESEQIVFEFGQFKMRFRHQKNPNLNKNRF